MRELRAGIPSLCSIGIATLLVSLGAGCSRVAPTAPDSIGVGSPAASASNGPDSGELIGFRTPSQLAEASVVTFDLLNGSFNLTVGGDHLAGTYTGRAEASRSGKADTASLDLQVASGTGAFQGANGTLRGNGKGAFSGEGPFELSLNGVLRTAAQRGASPFHATTAGTSSASCLNGRLLLTLQGTGFAVRSGHVDQQLRHEVGNTSCSS
jgi:hypothetical protein